MPLCVGEILMLNLGQIGRSPDPCLWWQLCKPNTTAHMYSNQILIHLEQAPLFPEQSMRSVWLGCTFMLLKQINQLQEI